jgi:hypothetical protein
MALIPLKLSLTRPLFARTIQKVNDLLATQFFAGFFRPDHDPPHASVLRAFVPALVVSRLDT